MNKTININLGGIFFHIDEIAYQKLKRYLDAIRRSLSDDPQGRDEIINDIEHRISELLSERVKDARQVVNESDIEEVTKIMGKPEDYLVDEEIFEDEPIYRKRTTSKKMFRDGEDKFLGGVCAGLAHYIGIQDVIWMRIIWLVIAFGFGVGFLIYPLLWILIPVAETTTEKLQMKGEPVNISNIEKKIREEFNDVSENIKDGVNNVTDQIKKKDIQNKAKSGFQELIDVIAKIITAIFNVFGKFIGAILILISSVMIIIGVLLLLSIGSIGLFDFGGGFNDSSAFIDLPPFMMDSVLPSWLLALFLFFAVAIPFVVLFLLGLKILSNNIKSFSTTTKLSLLGIWIISLLGLGFAGLNFATQTAHNGVYKQTEDLNLVSTDTLNIKMIGDENLSNRKELRRQYNFETVFDNDIKKLYSNRIYVDIKSTDNNTAFVKIRKESQGSNRLTANNDAESIEYEFKLTDSNLNLNGYFLSEYKNKYKNQQIDITVYLPKNSIIFLDKSTKTFLNDIDNVQNIYDRDMPKQYYKMTEKGLECLDCNPAIFGEDYKKKQDEFNLKIDENGINIKVNDKNKKAEVNIDETGITID
ncbi:phage shock protein C (PspC) family protein [Lutibacter oricola]|uniref:Phage shock protein C (PspC) family protein n=1 Tax=Lutibacter oricola TaxID=762486 RepID=A0A1H2Z6R5_9FLAO|nr:PspC domain-containing protein [Lutibacter oricola]SDX13090.1 phage shock protein C (PspC) family protein [Lutibacter oricola]